MKIVTAGNAHLDIDAYAGCIAYAELLRANGLEAIAASSAPLNESINQTLRSWKSPLQTKFVSKSDDTFILVDVSDPSFADQIVIDKNIEEVIDHHPGFQQYWNDRIGSHAQIEVIGAAATLIYEQWKRSGFFDQMTRCGARLLVSEILDNTLNFQAQITTERDRQAYRDLFAIAAYHQQLFVFSASSILFIAVASLINANSIIIKAYSALSDQSFRNPFALRCEC